MKILLPISLDRWRNPISTLQRACVEYNSDIEFHSFSNPQTDEDRELGEKFWKLPNLHKRHPSAIILDRFDIVHSASYSHGNYVACVLAKMRGLGRTRFLDTMNLEQHPNHLVCWARYKRVLRWVDGFVAVSHAVAADIRQRVPERFMAVIPNGVDSRMYGVIDGDNTDLPDSMRDIAAGYPLWLAAIEQRKHPEVLLQLAERNPQIKFIVLGEAIGDIGREYALKFEHFPNIIWLGCLPRRQAKIILSRAGVLLFPSEREGLSLAMIEAVALGVPIIAQPKSSMPELVESGINGELVEAQEIDAWDIAMKKWLCSRTEKQEENLRKCREHALEKFNWATVGAAYGPVYREILAKNCRLLYNVNAEPL